MLNRICLGIHIDVRFTVLDQYLFTLPCCKQCSSMGIFAISSLRQYQLHKVMAVLQQFFPLLSIDHIIGRRNYLGEINLVRVVEPPPECFDMDHTERQKEKYRSEERRVGKEC